MFGSATQSLGVFAQGTGASKIGFTQSGTNATKLLLSQLLARAFLPEMFGAAGDDATDDTTAFDKAQTAAGSDGVVVLMPRRKYRVGDLTLLGSREWLGNGAIIRAANPDSNIFVATSISDVVIRQMRFDGRKSAATSAVANKMSIYCRDTTDLRLEDLVFLNSGEDALYFGSATGAHIGCYTTYLNNISIKGASRNGISIVNVRGLYGHAITVRDTADASGAFTSGPFDGIDIEPGNGEATDEVHLSGITTLDNAGRGIHLYGLAGSTSGQQRVVIDGHFSRGDLHAFRVARFNDRASGSENVFRYRGESHNHTSSGGAYAIEELGDKTSLDVEATVYGNSTSNKAILTTRDSATYTSVTGVPKIRGRFSLFGRFNDVFGTGSGVFTSGDIYQDTEIMVDVRNATINGSGSDTDQRAKVWFLNGSTDAITRDKTASGNITTSDTLAGTRAVTNIGAGAVITLTLTTAGHTTDQEAEFAVLGTHGMILELEDTSKVIYPWGAYRVACFEIHGRVRLKKLSSGDWKAVACPLGQRGNWVLYGEATWDPASIANGARESKDVTVPGIDRGSFTLAALTRDTTGLAITCAGKTTDTATVTLSNNTGGAVDLASGTVRVFGWKPGLTA
jgi:hypothetical protein